MQIFILLYFLSFHSGPTQHLGAFPKTSAPFHQIKHIGRNPQEFEEKPLHIFINEVFSERPTKENVLLSLYSLSCTLKQITFIWLMSLLAVIGLNRGIGQNILQ